MGREAVFQGLVIDENEQVVTSTKLGGDAYYVVDDDGFQRHIPSEDVDRQVLQVLKEQVLSQRGAVVEGMLQFLGKDDLFTKAAVEASVDQMDENLEQLLQTGMPEEARSWLGMMGFRVTIDVHGDVVDLRFPATEFPEE
jgi:hypothetical protein